MSNLAGHARWPTRLLLIGAAVAVAGYALVAAWLVTAGSADPDPLALTRTTDGNGVVVSGAVADPDARDDLVDALAVVTDASLIVVEIEIDPDAEPLPEPRTTASALAASLSDGQG